MVSIPVFESIQYFKLIEDAFVIRAPIEQVLKNGFQEGVKVIAPRREPPFHPGQGLESIVERVHRLSNCMHESRLDAWGPERKGNRSQFRDRLIGAPVSANLKSGRTRWATGSTIGCMKA